MKLVFTLAAAFLAAASAGAPALADPIDDILAESQAAAAPEAAPGPAKGRTRIGEEKLGGLSAGDAVTYRVQAGQLLQGTTTGNTIDGNVDTGDVVFDAGALNGFSGVGNFVANTGANSNLNGSVMVNIVGAPAPGQ